MQAYLKEQDTYNNRLVEKLFKEFVSHFLKTIFIKKT